VREPSNQAGNRPAAEVMLDTMEPGAAVVMLSLLQWDAESGDQEAAGILAECWARLQAGLKVGDKRAIAVMAAWSEAASRREAEAYSQEAPREPAQAGS
jgi:hypothetical protein